MSKKESIQVLNSDLFYQYIYGDNNAVGGDMWDQARNGIRAAARAGHVSRHPAVNGYASFGVYYRAARGGMYYVYNTQIAFNTEGLTEPPSSLSIRFDTSAAGNTNVASDHKFIITAVQGGDLPHNEAISPTEGPFFSKIRRSTDGALPIGSTIIDDFLIGETDGGTNIRDGNNNYAAPYEGFISGSSFAETGRFYCDPQNLSGVDGGSTGIEITLNRNARLDVAKNNMFFVMVQLRTFAVLIR